MQRAASLSGAERHYTALLQTLHYVDRISPEELLAGHRQWNDRYAAAPSARPLPLPIEAPKNRRLRLGFLSCDFAATPIGYLALPALQHLDRTACSVICYHDRSATDGLTRQFMAASDAFVPVAGASDDACTTRIRQDEIDILVDLTGHYGNRLGVFARRAAPVQMTWLGYVGTTGLATMDCLLADWVHVAAGEEPWYSEQVLRMPHGYACYGPPAHVPDVGPLPAAAAERFTFGCLNGAFKYSPRVLDLWAEILRRVGHADLLLAPFWAADAEAEAALRGEFASRGIDPARVTIESCRPHLELLALYGRIDLALDTQPYSGGLTTCEALWMGVPVITFPGQRFAGRHATSHVIHAGYPQFVARGEGGYVELAAQWANRREELAAIRGQMRGQVRRSPLCDGPRFAEDFWDLLSGEWQRRGASRLQWL
jgi:predicted O-linked N-acetylglucosamine transferase (SPINDLY family)